MRSFWPKKDPYKHPESLCAIPGGPKDCHKFKIGTKVAYNVRDGGVNPKRFRSSFGNLDPHPTGTIMGVGTFRHNDIFLGDHYAYLMEWDSTYGFTNAPQWISVDDEHLYPVGQYIPPGKATPNLVSTLKDLTVALSPPVSPEELKETIDSLRTIESELQ